MFLKSYRYDSSNQSLHRTFLVCGEQFNRETFCFHPCIGFVTGQLFQNGAFFWIRSIFKLLLLSYHQFTFLHRKIDEKQSTFRRVFNIKFVLFLSGITILIVGNFQRKHFIVIFSGYSNSYSTKTTGFIPTIGVGIKKIQNSSCEEVFDRKTFDLCSVYQCFDSPNFPRSANFFISLLFQTGIPQPL